MLAAATSFADVLQDELQEHMIGLIVAGVLILITAPLSTILPPGERKRARNVAALCIIYAGGFLLGAYLESQNVEAVTRHHDLVAAVILSLALVNAFGLILFDVVLRRSGVRVPKVIRDLVQAAVFFVVVLWVLNSHGVNPLSIITTSVVFTAVIGFALQDTIGNFFAGLALQMENTLAVGDWIESDGKIGRIHSIKLRATSIVTKDGDLIALPNGQFLKGHVKNLSKPAGSHRLWMRVGIAYAHPPNDVKKVLLNALRGVEGALAEPPPDCMVSEFADYAVSYSLRYWISDFAIEDRVQSDVRTRVWYALRRAGFEIPFPTREINLTQVTPEQRELTRRADLERRRGILGGVDLFRNLPESALGPLAERLRKHEFGDGDVIIRQGDPGDSLYIIRNGQVAVRLALEGSQREVAVLKTGAFFGEMSLLTGETRKATCVAKDDCVCYVLDRAGFEDILTANESIAADISNTLAQRQSALEAERSGLSAAATAKSAEATSKHILGRIKDFFRLKT